MAKIVNNSTFATRKAARHALYEMSKRIEPAITDALMSMVGSVKGDQQSSTAYLIKSILRLYALCPSYETQNAEARETLSVILERIGNRDSLDNGKDGDGEA